MTSPLSAALQLLLSIAGQNVPGVEPTGVLRNTPSHIRAFEKSGFTAHDREMSGQITLQADTTGLPSGATFHWRRGGASQQWYGDVAISESGPTATVTAQGPGISVVSVEIQKADGKVHSPANDNVVLLSVPGVVVVKADSTLNSLLTRFAIPQDRQASIGQTMREIVENYLGAGNIRLVWRPGTKLGGNDPIPPILSGRKMRSDTDPRDPHTVAAIRKEISPSGLFEPIEPRHDVMPKFRTAAMAPWADVTLRADPSPAFQDPAYLEELSNQGYRGDPPSGITMVRQTDVYLSVVNANLARYGHHALLFPDVWNSGYGDEAEAIFARMVAQTIAHEAVHGLSYFWENTQPAETHHTHPNLMPNDLMIEGGRRTMLLRTGFDVAAADALPIGKLDDLGIEKMAQPTRSPNMGNFGTVDRYNQFLPNPGEGYLS